MSQRRRLIFISPLWPWTPSLIPQTPLARIIEIAARSFDVVLAVAGDIPANTEGPGFIHGFVALPAPGIIEMQMARFTDGKMTVPERKVSSSAGRRLLRRLVAEFNPDMVICDTLPCSVYGRNEADFPRNCVRVLALDDIRDPAHDQDEKIPDPALRHTARREAVMASMFDRVTVRSDADAERFATLARLRDIRCMPVALGETWVPDITAGDAPTFLFVGDGAASAVEKAVAVLEDVASVLPGVGMSVPLHVSVPKDVQSRKLILVGGGAPGARLLLAPGTVMLAPVPGATSTASLIAALASGVPLIGEPVSVGRVGAVPGVGATVAWGADGFAKCIARAVTDRAWSLATGKAGARDVTARNSDAEVTRQLHALFSVKPARAVENGDTRRHTAGTPQPSPRRRSF